VGAGETDVNFRGGSRILKWKGQWGHDFKCEGTYLAQLKLSPDPDIGLTSD